MVSDPLLQRNVGAVYGRHEEFGFEDFKWIHISCGKILQSVVQQGDLSNLMFCEEWIVLL